MKAVSRLCQTANAISHSLFNALRIKSTSVAQHCYNKCFSNTGKIILGEKKNLQNSQACLFIQKQYRKMLKAIKIILNFYIFPGTSGVLYLSMLKYYYSKYSSNKKENSSGKYFQIKFPCYRSH